DEAGECAGLPWLDVLPAAPRALLNGRRAGRGDQVRPVALPAGEPPDRMSRHRHRTRAGREVVRFVRHPRALRRRTWEFSSRRAALARPPRELGGAPVCCNAWFGPDFG